MTDQTHRNDYEAALRNADAIYAQSQQIDVTQLSDLVERLRREQLASGMPAPLPAPIQNPGP
jgi:hypothetical protein